MRTFNLVSKFLAYGVMSLLFGSMQAQSFISDPKVNQDVQKALSKTDKHFFIENKGQWHPDVLYLCRMGGLDAWITKYGVNYTFYKVEKAPDATKDNDLFKGKFDHDELENSTLLGHRVLFTLQDHNPAPATESRQKQEGYYNYLIGNDPSKHASNVGLYKEVVVKDVYHGIDIRYYFDRGYLRYDFIVHPGANPEQIKIKLDGQYDAYVKNNALCYTTRFGEVQMADLHTYQQDKTIASHFTKRGELWQVQVANYDKTQDLIIDPLIYSTYLGGSSDDYSYSIAVDASGNAYVTGETNSTDYDITPGAFQTAYGGGFFDVFVTKLNPTGTGLVYSTYLGGSNNDAGRSIAIDASGNAYVTGFTWSSNYDIIPGAFQTTNGGNADVFVTKLNPTGTGLIYSTYIGGSNDEVGNSIAIDASGNVYVAGQTWSTNYDISFGAFQTTYGGGIDGFVTKLNSIGTSLLYSTYLGGSNADYCFSIAVDASGHAYVTGETNSTDYDITPGAFQTTGFVDAFVTKLNPTGTGLVYSTYLGGSNQERGNSIAIDASGHAYVTGRTQSTDYDITPGAFQTTIGGGVDGFVTKLNPTGTGLVYSTYLGGSVGDVGYSIAIDASGNAYVTGYTLSTDFDITPGAFQTTYAGGSTFGDVFVTKLNPTGAALVYSTYLGGSNDEIGYSIALDATGNAYVTGQTQSTDYDITPGAFQTTYGGGTYDVFVTKLCIISYNLTSAPGTDNQTVCTGTAITNITYTTTGATGATFSGLPAGVTGNFSAGTVTISGTPTATGTFNYTVTLTGGCGTATATGTITVNPNNTIALTSAAGTDNQTVCAGTAITNITYSTTGATGATFSGLPAGVTGNFSAGTVTISGTPTATGTFNYTITLTGGCGMVTATGTIIVNPDNTINLTSAPGTDNQTVCAGTAITNISYTTTAATGATVSGLPAGVSGNFSAGTVTISGTPTATGTFNYTVTLTGGCGMVTATGVITVNPLPNASAGSNSPVCEGDDIQITGQPNGMASYTWSGPGSFSSNQQNPVITGATPAATGTYTLTVSDANGCSNTASVSVTVVPQFSVSASSNSPVCEGDDIQLSVNNVAGASYSWTGPGGYNSTQQNPVISNAGLSQNGVYTVTVTAGSCSESANVMVIIHPSPQLSLAAVNDTCLNHTGSVQAIVSSGTTPYNYLWNTGATTSGITGLGTGNYSVTVSDANGCSVTANAVIVSIDSDCDYFVYVANAFTPNGDGVNDGIPVHGRGVKELKFVIYNRWGNKVFETTQLNHAWDGTYKGELQNSAVFVYVLEAVFIDGSTHKESGEISLIR
jgi:gliding motility-associated-like protein